MKLIYPKQYQKRKSEETKNEFFVIVTDDGAGFNIEMSKQEGFLFPEERTSAEEHMSSEERIHAGIEKVRNRLSAMCQGTLFIQSKPGHGTTAIILIPKKEMNNEHPCG